MRVIGRIKSMSNKITVAIVVYNPDMRKFRATLRSVLCQKNIEYSVVIADDGSREVNWSSIESLFNDYSFKEYLIVKNDTNLGTVKNLYSAINRIDSEFVFTISPGDLLFDELTLFDIYEYCKDKYECSFFFGRAIYYQNNDGTITIGETLFPKLPHIYDFKAYPWRVSSTAYFSRQHICGASYFYRTEQFKKYLIEIIEIGIKYVEDFTTAAIYILDNNQVVFFDRNVIWYESNTGVSGSRNTKWNNILNEDFGRLKVYLQNKYENSSIVDAKYGSAINRIKHPIIVLMAGIVMLISHFKKNNPHIDESDLNRLRKLLSE